MKDTDLPSSDRLEPKSEGDLVKFFVCRTDIPSLRRNTFVVWIGIRMYIQCCSNACVVRRIMKFYKYSYLLVNTFVDTSEIDFVK